MSRGRHGQSLRKGSGVSRLWQRALRRGGPVRIKLGVEAVERRAVRADDLFVLTHIKKDVGMIIGRRRTNTHEFRSADLYDRHAGVVLEVGDNMFRHGNSSGAA